MAEQVLPGCEGRWVGEEGAGVCVWGGETAQTMYAYVNK
jgi:hypothetical protein